MNEMEEIIFQLITFSGGARSSSFEALDAALLHDFEKANKLIEQAAEELLSSHNIQTELIQKEARGERTEVNLLLVHAQDHLMTSILAKDLIQKMILMEEKIKQLEDKIVR
jgi:PTS system cellobiose-specific IIA component